MTLRRGLLLGMALLFTTACASTYQVRRPLPVERIPTDDATVQQMFAGMTVSLDNIRQSLKLTSTARDLFSTHDHDEALADYGIRKLGQALDYAPDNPYAWVQLGAYLALGHQPLAAANATERGLERLDRLCMDERATLTAAEKNCFPDSEVLRTVASLNLATYRTSAGKPLLATLALSKIDPLTLSPFHRLAYHWTSADTMTRLGDTTRAEAELIRAESVPPLNLAMIGPDANYALDDNQRAAVQAYLRGLICLEKARLSSESHLRNKELERASANLESAISLHHEQWDAQLALANTRVLQERLDDAIALLLPLSRAIPNGTIAQPERVSFNLGNAYFARFRAARSPRDLETARDAFIRAASLVEQRVSRTQKMLKTVDVVERSADVAGFFIETLLGGRAVFGEALNNLGLVYFAHLNDTKDPIIRKELVIKAEETWRKALGDSTWNERYLAWANLARVYVMDGRVGAAVDAADHALDGDPYHVYALEVLTDVANRDDDLTRAAHAAFGAASLVQEHHGSRVPSRIDEWLQQIEDRFAAMEPNRDIRRASIAIQLARQRNDLARQEIDLATQLDPEWSWPRVKLASLNDRHDTPGLDADLDAITNASVPTFDWVGKRERGDAFALRAELRADRGDAIAARRDIERAIADGADSAELQRLAIRVNRDLEQRELPVSQIIAVLPFVVLHAQGEAWPRALSTAVTDLLETVPDLRVVELESDTVPVLRKHILTPPDVGRRSGAGVVLAGYFSVANDILMVDVALWDAVTQKPIPITDAKTGQPILTRRYVRRRDETHAMLEAIVQDVIQALRLRGVAPGTLAAAHVTRNPRALAAYLSGMEKLLDERPENAREADASFVGSLTEERFAAALAGRVYAKYELSNLYERPSNVMSGAREAAEEAVGLDDNSAFVSTALALVRTWLDWDLDEGEAAFRHAIELRPHKASHHRYYGDLLLAQGRFEEALAEKDRASELAPLSSMTQLELALPLFYLGRYKEAARQVNEALTLDRRSWRAYLHLSWVYTKMGQYDEAHLALDSAERNKPGRSAYLLSHRAVIFARAGEYRAAEAILADLLAHETDDKYILPLLIARVYDALHRPAEARIQLEHATKDRSESIVWLAVDPWLDNTRNGGLLDDLIPPGVMPSQSRH